MSVNCTCSRMPTAAKITLNFYFAQESDTVSLLTTLGEHLPKQEIKIMTLLNRHRRLEASGPWQIRNHLCVLSLVFCTLHRGLNEKGWASVAPAAFAEPSKEGLAADRFSTLRTACTAHWLLWDVSVQPGARVEEPTHDSCCRQHKLFESGFTI